MVCCDHLLPCLVGVYPTYVLSNMHHVLQAGMLMDRWDFPNTYTFGKYLSEQQVGTQV